MLRSSILAAIAAVALGACASAQTAADSAPESRDCFRPLDVRGYGVVDDHTIRVHVSPTREYYLSINALTRDLDWTHAISIRSTMSFVCVGNGAGVHLMGGDPPFPYQVTRIERAPSDAPTGS